MFCLSTPSATSGWIATPIAAVRQGGERRSVPELIEVFDLSRLIFEVLRLRERVMIFLGFGTGLPRGELGGIKWEDIDFETGQLQPSRSIVRQHVGKTKTEASRNIIPVDEHLLADLRAWRRETPYAENGDYIFASPKMKGKQPLWLDTVIKKIIKPAAAKAGIRLKGWHTLRHTYSTLLKANGNDPKVVQELLRHAKLATTMDGYTQALSPDKRRGSPWSDSTSGTTTGTTEISCCLKCLKMVDLVGIEPTTSSMPWKRAPSCATGPRSKTRRIGIEGIAKSFSPTSLG